MKQVIFKNLGDKPEMPDGAELVRITPCTILIQIDRDVSPAHYILDSNETGNIAISGKGLGIVWRAGSGKGDAFRVDSEDSPEDACEYNEEGIAYIGLNHDDTNRKMNSKMYRTVLKPEFINDVTSYNDGLSREGASLLYDDYIETGQEIQHNFLQNTDWRECHNSEELNHQYGVMDINELRENEGYLLIGADFPYVIRQL